MTAERWSQLLSEARADAALSAYSTALDWLRRYPAAEVERCLEEKVNEKRAALRERPFAVKSRTT
jgi:hypothetical protein